MLAAPSLWILPQGPVAVLLEEARVHRALRHPYLHALVCRELPEPDRALSEVFLQLMPWVAALRPAMGSIAGRVGSETLAHEAELAAGVLDPHAKAALLDAELGHLSGYSHLELYVEGLNLMGLDGAWEEADRFTKRTWTHLRRFNRMTEHADPLHALGASVLGTHLIFPEVATMLMAALKDHPRGVEAAELLGARNVLVRHTQDDVLQAVEVLSAQPQGLRRLAGGRTLALDALAHLFDGLMEKAWRGD
ncbi:MAG: hypothetical protein VX899_15855 [Myxococcota bacterium]|nr:hypothetical protein [Myxococcota bacterium]